MHQGVPSRLVNDQALILVGPQGCGKTLLATELAKKHAPYKHVEIEHLLDDHLFHHLLKSHPKAIIVDGFAENATERTHIRTLAASRTWSFNMKRSKTTHTFKVPHLIFCVHDDNPFLPADQDRRFRVFAMPDGWKPTRPPVITYRNGGGTHVFGVDTTDRRFFVTTP